MAGPTIIVVGAGTAGLPAAIQAADAGATVIVIEKTDKVGGTLWLSSATMSAAGSRLQKAKGIDDSPQQHYDDCWKIGRGKNDPALLRLATEHAAESIDWLQDIGVPFTAESPRLAPEHDFYSRPRSHDIAPNPANPGPGRGKNAIPALERALQAHIDAGRATLRLNTRVTGLLQDATGRVVGVQAERDGATDEIRADAVVLATGGYGANQALFRQYHPQWKLVSLCPPSAQGDGLDLVSAIGGAIVHMDMMIPLPGGVEDPREPGTCLYWVMLPNQRPAAVAGDIYVNKHGLRYIREDEPRPDNRERAIMAQPESMMIAIFDEPMRDGLTPAISEYTKRELEGGKGNPNVIISAPTIEELAVKLELDPATLRATVDRYNSFVRAGKDEDFGREAMPKEINEPPFHAVRTYGTVLGTMGGVKVNDSLQVLRPDGAPIPGLYAAGELLGKAQIMGDGLCSGFAAGPAVSFGMLAGRNATRATQPVA